MAVVGDVVVYLKHEIVDWFDAVHIVYAPAGGAGRAVAAAEVVVVPVLAVGHQLHYAPGVVGHAVVAVARPA